MWWGGPQLRKEIYDQVIPSPEYSFVIKVYTINDYINLIYLYRTPKTTYRNRHKNEGIKKLGTQKVYTFDPKLLY